MRSGRERRRDWRKAQYRQYLETLETRVLLTVFMIHDSGNTSTNGTNLQNAINSATTGDTIIIDAGITCVAAITLPAKGFAVGSAPVVIESSMIGSLPAGVRVGPAQASLMAKIQVTNAGNTAIVANADSHDYQLLGLEVTAGPVNAFNNLVALGANTLLHAADAPTNIVVDRCYIHGVPNMDQKNGVTLNGLNITVENSYISEIHSTFQDAQAISGSDGPGHYTITNNYLEASGEDILFGGADPADVDSGFEPNDTILVQGNYFSKQMSWDPYSPAYVAPSGPVSGTNYWVKNLFELKNASNVTLNDNLLENNWAGADQFGFAIVLTPRNQNGGDPTARVQNVTITNNVIRHAGGGVTIFGQDASGSTAKTLITTNITIRNNLFYDIGGPLYGAKGGQGFQPTTALNPSTNVVIDHNTTFETNKWFNIGANASTNPVITNNVAYRAQLGFQGNGQGEGTSSLNNAFPSGYIFGGNVVIAANSASYPAGNFFPATGDATVFADFPGENFGLAANSPYFTDGVDSTGAPNGSTPGVNMALLDPEWLPNSAGIKAFYKFDEGAGTSASDASGNGHTGTLSGSTLPTWTTGQTLNGLNFNGTTAYVSVPTFAAPTDLTLAAFIKPSDHTGTNSTIMSKGGTSEFSMQIQANGYLQVTIAGVTLTDTAFNYYAAGNTSKWYLVGATFNSATDTVTIYRNGVADVTGVNTGVIADSGLPMWIGRDVESNSGSFLGVMDDVRYYDRALTSSQMAGLYAGYAPQVDYINLPYTVNGISQFTTGTTATLGNSNFPNFAVSHVAFSALTFTWSVYSQPAGVAPPTFSPNGTNASKNTTVTFHGAGTYVFSVTVADPSGVSATYQDTPRVITPNLFEYDPIRVSQTLTSIVVSPPNATVNDNATKQFTATAFDQFGIAMVSQPSSFTWSLVSGVGSVNSSGLYTAPASGTGTASVKALSGTPFGTASVNVTSTLSPTVVSINRVTGVNTNASSVAYTVTFSTSVTGVDATDFTPAMGTGLSGATVGTVSGSGATWTVNVNTGSGSGTLGLNLIDNDSIVDGSANPLGGAGTANGNYTNSQTYLLDRVLPTPTITSPTTTSLYNTGTPTISGIGGIAVNDTTGIAVKIYAGPTATGSPVQTFSTTANAATGVYSVANSTPLVSGQYTVQVSQGDAASNTGTSNAVTFTVDTVGPQVTGVYVASSGWSAAFLNYLATSGQGSATLGFKVSDGANQLKSLPWINLDKISLTFLENVNITKNLLALTGINVPTYAIASFTYDPASHTATWTLNQAMNADRLLLALAGASGVNDLANNNLDGEWTDSTSTTSGNGAPGGNFNFHANVLPADINQDGSVDGGDFDIWFTHLLSNTFDVTQGDLNADGHVDGGDFDIWFTHLLTVLPPAPPIAGGNTIAPVTTENSAPVTVSSGASLTPAPVPTSTPIPTPTPATTTDDTGVLSKIADKMKKNPKIEQHLPSILRNSIST